MLVETFTFAWLLRVSFAGKILRGWMRTANVDQCGQILDHHRPEHLSTFPHHSWLITLSLRTKGRFYPHLPFHPHLPGLELAPNVDGTWTDKLTTVECLVTYTHNLLHGIMFLIITGVLTIPKSFILSVGNFDPVGCLTIETSWC